MRAGLIMHVAVAHSRIHLVKTTLGKNATPTSYTLTDESGSQYIHGQLHIYLNSYTDLNIQLNESWENDVMYCAHF